MPEGLLTQTGRVVTPAEVDQFVATAVPADVTAPAVLTAAAVATADAAAPSAAYDQVEAATAATLANALKVEINKVVADNVALRTKLAAQITAHNALLDTLIAAGLLTA